MGDLNLNGVKLHYVEAGSGEPPIVFVHGWCCNHTYFGPQFDHFAKDHRVVAVDLRGHGSSDKPEQDYTVSGFADDVVAVCRELDVEKPVVVGHSMGGAIVFDIAGRYPDLPTAAVLVDPAPIVPMPGLREQMAPLVEALHGAGYREAQRMLLENFLFIPADDAEVKARVIEEMGSAPQHVMASAFAAITSWEGEAVAANVRVPVLIINAGDGMTDLNRARELCPTIELARTVGAGHFHQLLVPDQVNAMIAKFLQLCSAGVLS